MEDPLPSRQEYLAAYRKTDAMKLILIPQLEGCIARRYNFPEFSDIYCDIQPCFVQSGPIVPIISLNYSKYLGNTGACLHYFSMLEDRRIRIIQFPGPKIPGALHLDQKPEALASK